MPLQPSGVPSRAAIQAAIDEAVANHASLVDAAGLHYDSGWADIPLRSGYTGSGETPRYRRIGRMVFLRGRVAPTSGSFAAGTTVIVGDVPGGFRPNPLVVFALAGSTGASFTSAGRWWVDTSGQINMQPQSTTGILSVACSFLNN